MKCEYPVWNGQKLIIETFPLSDDDTMCCYLEGKDGKVSNMVFKGNFEAWSILVSCLENRTQDIEDSAGLKAKGWK